MLQTASIHSYKTSKGTRWAVRYRQDGKQRHETVPGYGREAKEIARERAREIELGRHFVARSETLGAFLEGWLERQANQVKPVTLKRKQDALRALGALDEREPTTSSGLAVSGSRLAAGRGSSLSSSSLDRLTVPEVEDALAALARRAPRQAQMACAAFKMALRSAKARGQRFDEGLLELKPNRYQSREPRFLTWEQVTELQSWMPEYVCRIVPIAALTGLREGELFELREWDLVLSEREAEQGPPSATLMGVSPNQLRESGSRSESYLRVRSGKTEASTRTVTLPATAVQLLREQLLARTHTEGGYVFPAPQGGRWSVSNFMGRVYRPAREHAGMEDVNFHDLRHTYASLMGAAGVDVATIASQLGHKDGGALLLRRYRHIFPSEASSAASRLDALVQQAEVNPAKEEKAK